MDSATPAPPSALPPSDATEAPVFSVRDLEFQILVTSAILRTLDLDQMLYVVLSGVTSGEGLAFNRGLVLLVDDGQRYLRTSMAIGPADKQEAHRIWEDMKAKALTLGALLSQYDASRDDPAAHALTQNLGHVCLPMVDLDQLADASPDPKSEGSAPVTTMLARTLRDGRLVSSDSLRLVCEPSGIGPPVVFETWCMVPLLTPDRRIGVLLVDNAYSPRSTTERERHLLVALANLTAIAFEKARMFSRIRALAEVDGLTGLANRRTYDLVLERLLTEARQTGRPLSLVLLDIDHFKQTNDRFGHLVGDDVLREVASVLAANARKSDVVARYGGEEFAVILPDTTIDQAEVVARKLLHSVRQAPMCGGAVRVTVSAGVASSPAGVLDGVSLFDAADKAIYRAKRSGRDRVETAGFGVRLEH